MSKKDCAGAGPATAATEGGNAGGKMSSTIPSNAVIVAFGDSLTFGTGATTEHSYPSELERLVSRRVVNAGIPGEDTERGLQRLQLVLDEYRPSLVILCHGANDLKQGFGDLQASENIRAMIRICRDRGIMVVLVGIPYPTLFTSKPPFYAKIAQEFAVPFARDAVADVLADPSLKSDSIHPNARGYRKIAEAVAELLRKCGIV
jgi:acyl-CoA thioesterase-1